MRLTHECCPPFILESLSLPLLAQFSVYSLIYMYVHVHVLELAIHWLPVGKKAT